MDTNEPKQFEKPLNLRERMGIIALIAILKILKAGEGVYFLDEEIKKLKEYISLT